MPECPDIIIPTCKTPEQVTGQVAEIRLSAPGSRVIATCTPECAAVNRNLGLDAATGRYVVMVDDDVTRFPNGWAETLAQVLAEHANAVMVSASLLHRSGRLGQMLGDPGGRENGDGLLLVPRRELPTACICIVNDGTRFDEGYVGSGWEDTAFCAQLRALYPAGEFYIAAGVRVTHLNEMKRQGENFARNKARYISVWGQPQGRY